MKRGLEDTSKHSDKKFRRATFLDRVCGFLQWLPGVAELTSPSSEYTLPPTQAWTRTCPDHSLRCPGCGQYLEAPVKQCVNGHSVCLKCRHSLLNCPTCRDHFIRTPQPVLDRLLSTTRLPCLYAAYGCPVLEVLRRRESHSRYCSYRPSSCPLCAWETPPRAQDRGDQTTGQLLLARHMTSAHRHHVLELDKEHKLSAWLEFKKQTTAFLSCAITVDEQVFVFVMNYDTKRRKFFIVLKYVASLDKGRYSSKSCEIGTYAEEHQLGSNNLEEFSCNENSKVPSEEDSFERTKREGIFRGQRDCEHCYLIELIDSKGIQSVRLIQTALNEDDALDLAVKSDRCLSVDFALLERLLEPGNGQFTVKITISRIQLNVEDSVAASMKKNVYQANVSEDTSLT